MNDLWISLRVWVLTLILCSGVYPLIVFAWGKLAFASKGEGSLLYDETGQALGSVLIAQKFTRSEYLWPRPSAVDYNASAAGGSNLGPSNPQLQERIQQTLSQYGFAEGESLTSDLLTASGSGLDPHITLAGALLQVPRIAAARSVEQERVVEIIQRNVKPANLWTPALVHVLLTNLAFDRELGPVNTKER